MNLPHLLDEEFKRLSKETGKTMEALVAEVAALSGFSPRHIYNFRSGKWPVPTDLIPVLYKQYGSTVLLDALNDECKGQPVEVPEPFDLTRLVSQTVRDDLTHYERFLKAFEDGRIDDQELGELRSSSARIIQNVRTFEAIAVADHARQRTTHDAR